MPRIGDLDLIRTSGETDERVRAPGGFIAPRWKEWIGGGRRRRCQRIRPSGIFASERRPRECSGGEARPSRHSGASIAEGVPRAQSPALGRVLFCLDPKRIPRASARERSREFFSRFRPEDTILCLCRRSLLISACPGRHELSRKREAIRRCRSGAGIAELNGLRTRSPRSKGDVWVEERGPARDAGPFRGPGDDPSSWSGRRSKRRRDRVVIVGSNASGLAAAAREAVRLGFKSIARARRLSGEAREAGGRFARTALRLAPGGVLMAGGETTVKLSSRRGRGGRNLEFALGAALELAGHNGIAILAAGSDGVDGSSRATGASATERRSRGRRLGLDPHHRLDGTTARPSSRGSGICSRRTDRNQRRRLGLCRTPED